MSQAHFKVKVQSQSYEPFFLAVYPESSKANLKKKSKSRKIIRQNSQKYHWRHKENIKYLEFIISARLLFDLDLEEKRYLGINKLMSSYIKTRDSVQCHSHHQKIVKKYGSIDQAIAQMTKIYIKKSKFLRRKNQKLVKIEQSSFWHIKQDEIEQKLSNKQEQAIQILAKAKYSADQVKTEQIQEC